MNRRDFIIKNILTTGGIVLSGLSAFALNKQHFTNTAFRFAKADFGTEFQWGAACSAYQTEGAYNTDGRGMSIWDTFSHTKGKIHNNSNGDIATNFYKFYQKDVSLLKQMNFKNFRFSLSWSRIIPDGTGKVNQKGVDFYNRLINYCLENDISPWITLYHWDLPQALENKGGWTNREIINWFVV